MLHVIKLIFTRYRTFTAISAILFLIALALAGGQRNLLGRVAVFAADRDNNAQLIRSEPPMPKTSAKGKFYRSEVGAVNGVAFFIVDGKDKEQRIDIRTTMPVFKAFGMTSDGGKLLYSPLVRGVPSGELYLEDMNTGQKSKITDRIVLNAAISPTNDQLIAFTFAGGSSFGLALADIGTGRVDTLVEDNIYSEILQWSESGDGLYCFQSTVQDLNENNSDYSATNKFFEKYMRWESLDTGTASQDAKIELVRKYVPMTLNATRNSEFYHPNVPPGFPVLGPTSIPEFSSGASKRTSFPNAENDYSFRISSYDGQNEIRGNNLIGSSDLIFHSLRSGADIDVGQGQVLKVIGNGALIREYSEAGTKLKFVDWNGNATLLGLTAVNYNLPVQSGLMIQGGTAYPAPGNCNISAHSGSLEYAYDFQNPTVGAHALASADGLVVLTVSSITCNSVQTTCPDYVAGGCPGSFLGNVVVIQHADGTYSKYAHMQTDSPQAVVGTMVDQGLYIGRQGHTGSTSGTFNSCGDHLHFQRQSSPDIFGQSVAVDFADVAVQPLSCGVTYASASTEIYHAISPASQAFGIGGGSGVVSVTSTGGTWSAVSNDTWINIDSAGAGNGDGQVAYTVADNSAGGPRTGSMFIGGHVFTVSQDGTQPPNQAPSVNAGSDQTITLPASAILNGTATDDGLPNPPATLTTTWSQVSGPGTVSFGNANALNTTANFSLAGIYILRLTADDGFVASSDDLRVTVNVLGAGGSLTGSSLNPGSVVDLTSEGTEDWVHWGLTGPTSFDHKNGVLSQISDYSNIGNIAAHSYTGNPTTYQWTDGTPTGSANTDSGVFTYEVGNGFQIVVPADTFDRTLRLHVGVWSAGGRLEASLSDGSASPFVDTSLVNQSAVGSAIYSLTYRAASNGQSMIIRWTVDSSFHPVGNVTLQAATLVVDPPTPNQAPSVNAGSDQTITLPATASLSGTATDDGLPNPPATLTTTWSQVSGPGTVSFGNANALNTTASFSLSGTYVLRLTGSDSVLSSADDLTVTVNAAGGAGSLSASSAATPTNVDLPLEGTADWVHWGLNSPTSFDHKSGALSQISDYTVLGSGTIQRYANNISYYSWTGGTPTASTSNTATGVYVKGLNNGFQITAPAGTALQTLKVYVGVWAAGGRFEASLSDGSVPVYVDTALLDPTTTSNRVYTINYQAASPGQTITIKWTVDTVFNQWSNVTLQGAALR